MRIAFLTAEYPPQPGGIGDYTQRLANELVAHWHSIFVVTIADASCTIYDVVQQCCLYKQAVAPRTALWGWGCWRDIITALDILRPDVLHIQYQTGAYGMHPAINVLPWRLQYLPGAPAVVVTFHDLLEPYLFPKAGPIRRWMTDWLAWEADKVIVTNDDDAYMLTLRSQCTWPMGGCERAAKQVWTIPIGANIIPGSSTDDKNHSLCSRLGLQAHDFVVAYFGLLSPSKGLDTLLDMLDRLDADDAPVILIIGGAATAPQDRAYAEWIKARIDQVRPPKRIIMTGHVDSASVSTLLQRADCVVLPFCDGASFRRGSLLAALSHGCAVITTRPTAPKRALQDAPRLLDGENVLLVPPHNPGALSVALKRLINDSALRAQLGRGAVALGTWFAWGTIAQRHSGIYEELLR